MKKIVSLFLIICSIMTIFGENVKTYASEFRTPSEIEYDKIDYAAGGAWKY